MPAKKTPKSRTTDINALATTALAALKKVAGDIPVDDVSPEDMAAAHVGNRVPDEAMTIAATLLEADPKRFPAYDAKTIRSALAYEQAMKPLGTQVTLLGQQITRTAYKRKGDAATQTLSLYQSLKGLARLSKSEPTRTQQRALQKLLTNTRKPRSTTVTQAEAKKAVKGVKQTKVAAHKASLAAAATADAAQAAELAGLAAPTEAPAPAAAPIEAPPVTTAPVAVTTGH